MNDTPNENITKPDAAHDENWGVIAHLSALAGLFLPYGNIVGPLVVLLTKGKDSQFIGDQAKEALNFQITASIILTVCAMLMFLLIGFILFPIAALIDFVLTLLAASAASKGQAYQYPMTLRLFK